MSNAPETSVPPELLDIVRQLKELTEAGRLTWEESRPNFLTYTVTVSLASGQWRLNWQPISKMISVAIWDDTGTSIFDFTVKSPDPHFPEVKAVYDAAVRTNREQITSRALSKMREELAAR